MVNVLLSSLYKLIINFRQNNIPYKYWAIIMWYYMWNISDCIAMFCVILLCEVNKVVPNITWSSFSTKQEDLCIDTTWCWLCYIRNYFINFTQKSYTKHCNAIRYITTCTYTYNFYLHHTHGSSLLVYNVKNI